MYKNASLLLTASVVRYGGQLAVFGLFARWLGAAAAGRFAFALAVTAPVFMLASLGMRDIYLTLRTDIALAHYEQVRAVTAIAAIVVSVALSFLFPMNVAILVAVVACSKALDSFNDLYGAAMQKSSRIKFTVLTSAIVAILQVATLATALALGAPMPTALGLSTLSYLMSAIFVIRPITYKGLGDNEALRETGKSSRPWIEIVRVGFPTGISLGLLTGVSTLPQYFLSWTRGPTDVGKYAIILYLVVAMEMALNALAQSWIPVGRALEWEGMLSSRRILGVAVRWTLIALPFALVGIGIAAVAFPLVLGPAYTITMAEAIPLAVAMILTPAFFAATTSLAIQNRYQWGLIGSALTILAGIFIGWAIIKPFGVPGALWTLAVCLALRTAAALMFTKHEPRVPRAGTAELEVL